jgi:rRNA-processing protein FCF1
MVSMGIRTKLQQLFALEKELFLLLENEEYESFQQRQNDFSEQIKQLLDNHPAEILSVVIEELKALESAVENLQSHSKKHFLKLKQQSLLNKRNKKKINAYK